MTLIQLIKQPSREGYCQLISLLIRILRSDELSVDYCFELQEAIEDATGMPWTEMEARLKP